MNDFTRGLVVIALAIGIPIGLAYLGATIEKRSTLKVWNDGTHNGCGGKWELYSATHVRNTGTQYHYQCKKCKEVFQSYYHVK